MKIKLEKNRYLTENDFKTLEELNANVSFSDNYYEYLDVKKQKIIDFYRVDEKDVEGFNSVNKSVKKVNDFFDSEKFDFVKYANAVEKLNKKLMNYKNMRVVTNKNMKLEAQLRAEIKYDFQLESQHTYQKKKQDCYTLYSVEWTESERGWGLRPDGFSLHRDENEAILFVKQYIDKQPKDYVPDEYSRPEDPKLIEVSESLYNYVMEYGSVWLAPNNVQAYKTYDATKLIEEAKKQKKKM